MIGCSHMLRLYLCRRLRRGFLPEVNDKIGSLSMGKCFDVKAKCRAHTCDIFIIELLEDSGFSCVVQPPRKLQCYVSTVHAITCRNNILISFSFCLFFLMIVRSPMVAVSKQAQGGRQLLKVASSQAGATHKRDTLIPENDN